MSLASAVRHDWVIFYPEKELRTEEFWLSVKFKNG